MRIGIITTEFQQLGKHSGIHQYLNHVNMSEFELALHITKDGNNSKAIRRIFNSVVRRLIIGNKFSWYSVSDLTAELKMLLWLMGNKPVIIHYLFAEHGLGFLPKVVKFFKFSNIKIIATYHQPPEKLERLVSKNLLRHIDCVTLMSPSQLPFFRNFYPKESTEIILHGIDCSFFKPGKTNRNVTDTTFKCLSVGNWLRDWNLIEEIAKHYSNDSGIEFHFVTSHTINEQVNKRIFLHKHINDDALKALYQECDLLLLPLIDATANNAILEAQACGLPIITTELISSRTYIADNACVLVSKNNTDDYIAQIDQLRISRQRLLIMSKCARQNAQQLDWRKVSTHYEKIYRNLV